jgi:hypothetical protein
MGGATEWATQILKSKQISTVAAHSKNFTLFRPTPGGTIARPLFQSLVGARSRAERLCLIHVHIYSHKDRHSRKYALVPVRG